MKDIHDVITHAEFGDDRLRGLGVVAGQISAFPIDFAGRPYNTLALPCERVISSLRNSMVCASHFLTVTAIVPMPRLHIRAFLLITIPYLGRINVIISMF